LVVLDLSMPVMNGLEAARELKRLFPSVALVMFTSLPTAHLKQEALSAGVSALRVICFLGVVRHGALSKKAAIPER
jgi:CheY-like chemotaxis protein